MKREELIAMGISEENVEVGQTEYGEPITLVFLCVILTDFFSFEKKLKKRNKIL